MAGSKDFLDQAAAIAKALRTLGFEPVLVGGMALVILGSRRVTRDFDFVIAQPGDRIEELTDVFYDRGLELASHLSDEGDVTATIRNRRVASIRLRLDAPASAYFFNPRTAFRVDLLFDFPIPAATLASRATRTKVRARLFLVASEQDLLRLKRIAKARRSSPGDAQDIAFLEARRRTSKESP
jgi:hypothetical protein